MREVSFGAGPIEKGSAHDNPLAAGRAAAKARYVMNLYAAGLAPNGTRDVVTAIFEDFARLAREA